MLPAHQIDLKRDQVAWQVILLQHARENLDGCLELFRNYLIGSDAVEPFDFRNITSANDDRELGLEPPRLGDNARGRHWIGNGDDEHPRDGDTHTVENFRPRAVAEETRLACVSRGARNRRVHVENTVTDADLLEHAREILSIDAVADDNYMAGRAVGVGRLCVGNRRRTAERALQTEAKPMAPLDEEWRRDQTQDRCGQKH